MATEKPKLTAKQINEAAEQLLKEKAPDQKIVITKRAVIKDIIDPLQKVAPDLTPPKEAAPKSPAPVAPAMAKKILPIHDMVKPPAPSTAKASEPEVELNETPEAPDTNADDTESKPPDDEPLVDKSRQVSELINSGEYFLPINSVEKKRAKRTAILGMLLIVVLAGAWFAIALDAGLIEVAGIEPVTDFFAQ